MKKLNVLFAACSAAAILMAGSVCAEEADYLGTWYADALGNVMTVTINEDGTYTAEFAGESDEGTWEETDEGLMLDEQLFTFTEEGLDAEMDESVSLHFGREKIEAFVLPEIDYEAQLDEFQGKWAAYKVGMEGLYLDVKPEDDIFVTMDVNDTSVTLDGFIVTGMAFDLEYQDGGLSQHYEEGEFGNFEMVAVNLLEDGSVCLALIESVEDNSRVDFVMKPAEDIEAVTEAATE